MFQFYYLSHANNGQNVEKKFFPPGQKGNFPNSKGAKAKILSASNCQDDSGNL